MQDPSETQARLAKELVRLRQRVAELEASEAERKRAEQLASLDRIGLTITSDLDLERVLQALHKQCRQALPTDVFSVALYDEQTGLVHFPLFCDRGEYQAGLSHNIREQPGPTGHVIQTRQTLYAPDTTDPNLPLPTLIIRAEETPARAYIGVPLILGDRVIGALSVQSYQPNAYSPDDIRLLETLATQAAIAIENSRLFEAARRRAEQMTTLNLIGLAITSGLDMERILRTLDDQCKRLAVVDLFYVALYDQETGLIHFPVIRKGDEYRHVSPNDMQTQPGLTGYVIQSGQTLYLRDTLDPSATLLTQQINIGGELTRSYLGVPLIFGDKVIGVLSIQSYQPNAYSPDDVRLLETIAPQTAVAIENARLFEQARQHARHMALLNDITRAAISAPNLQDTLRVLSSQLAELFDADSVYITQWDEMTQHTIPAAAYGPSSETYTALRPLPGETTMTASVLRAGHALVAEDVTHTPYISSRIASSFITRSMLGLPLIADGTKLGAVLIGFGQPHRFTRDEIARGEQAAAQIALAIAKTQLFQTTLNERSRLQALITSSRDGILLSSLEGHILVINTQALQFLHLPGRPQDWLNRHLEEILEVLRRFAPKIVKAARREIQRIQSGDESPSEGEVEVLTRALHWLNLPVMAGSSRLGRLIVLRDVTEQHAVERLREDMTHTMVHDLRNPLGNISTTISVLRSGILGELGPDHLMALQAAETSVRRMTGLINAILDVSQLESGQMPLDWQAFDLAHLTAETVQAQMVLADEKSLHLESNVSPSLPLAWGDPILIGRVLQNLLDNATKFTPTGGQIQVTARVQKEDGHARMQVSVCDTGPGIPPEVQPRLFQKFSRGEQRERGSGLGLAFCKLVVEAHQERIWVESTSASGTTITFSLATADLHHTLPGA
jgi:signal transduction histidine kinase/putative methionine-R-sulfoxide reductase with GAF domain